MKFEAISLVSVAHMVNSPFSNISLRIKFLLMDSDYS